MTTRILSYLNLRSLLELVVRRPTAVIMGIAAVSFLFAAQIPNLTFSTSIYDLIIEDLPETARYREFKEIFGSDEIIRVVIKAKNVFDPATFRKIEQLSETAGKIRGVRRVISLPEVKKAVDRSGGWEMEKFAEVVKPIGLFQRNLISEDNATTVLTLVLDNNANIDQVIADVEKLIDRAGKDLTLYQIGMPLVSKALAEFTENDFFRLPPVTFILIATILLLLFRSVRYLFLPLMSVSLSLLWTFGLMALTETPLSMVIMIVPVFLIAVGTAYCLHVVSACLSASENAPSPSAMVKEAFSQVGFPTVLAVCTTVIGLGSLLLNRIPAIQEFAIFSCFGMVSLLVIVLTFFPAALSLMPLPEKKTRKADRRESLVDRFLHWIIRVDLNHQRIALPILGIVVVFAVLGIFQIRVETNPVGYFRENTTVSRNFHDIYRHLSGSFPVNMVMKSPEEYHFENFEHIKKIERLQKYLDTLPGVDKTVSFADYLKLVNYVYNRFDAEKYRLPEADWEARSLINNYRSMLGEDMMTRFMNEDFSAANILLLTHISSSRDFLDTREKILDHVEKDFSKDMNWEVTGFGMVISASSHLLTSGQVKSLSLTMLLVFGIMFLLFLSSKVGFIAILPNLFPILINFGIMGWFGIELSMFTSLIASIAIGLAVDDTIHYMVRYNREFKIDLDDRRALRETIMHMGRPIVFTTITISIGFAILAFSSFKPTAIFGMMMVITMISALIGDLILLPSLMTHVELVTVWDLIRLKLGKEPRLGIPLFKDLSGAQINYILMAGTLKEFKAGEVLFRKGDSSDSMYAIISGELDVLDPLVAEGPDRGREVHKLIKRLQVGDVVGEMGLIREARRSATVIGKIPGELLTINRKMIRRLQWLYPPTAHRFFFNLMNILSDRLEIATHCVAELSLEDDLTRLCNRRGFVKMLDAEVYRAKRFKEELTLLLMSVDFETGDGAPDPDARDDVLQHVSHELFGDIRKCDTFARIDLHTFALLMPRTSAIQAQVVYNRLDSRLGEQEMAINGSQASVTLKLIDFSAETLAPAEELLCKALEHLKPGT